MLNHALGTSTESVLPHRKRTSPQKPLLPRVASLEPWVHHKSQFRPLNLGLPLLKLGRNEERLESVPSVSCVWQGGLAINVLPCPTNCQILVRRSVYLSVDEMCPEEKLTSSQKWRTLPMGKGTNCLHTVSLIRSSTVSISHMPGRSLSGQKSNTPRSDSRKLWCWSSHCMMGCLVDFGGLGKSCR